MGESAEAEPGPTTPRSVRSGPVRAATDRFIRELIGKRTIAQAIRELPPLAGVNAILAQRYATAVDRAHDAGDDARLFIAGEKLRAVLERLESAKVSRAPEGGTPDDGNAGSDGPGRLYSILDRPAAVGDAAHP